MQDICELCKWQDDGQDDPYADEVWGGPNYQYSLTQARENFKRYWTKRNPDDPHNRGRGNSPAELEAKKNLVGVFQAIANADESEQSRLWNDVKAGEAALEYETYKELREVTAASETE